MGVAIPGKDFLALMKTVGFDNAEIVKETSVNSPPATKGVLLRAVKPLAV